MRAALQSGRFPPGKPLWLPSRDAPAGCKRSDDNVVGSARAITLSRENSKDDKSLDNPDESSRYSCVSLQCTGAGFESPEQNAGSHDPTRIQNGKQRNCY